MAFPCSNNQAKYEALAIGLDLASEKKVSELKICRDSNLIIKQVSGYFTVEKPYLITYREKIQKRLQGFKNYKLDFIPRSMNKYVDALTTLMLKIRPIKENLIQIPLGVKEKLLVSGTKKSGWILEIKEKLEDSKWEILRRSRPSCGLMVSSTKR